MPSSHTTTAIKLVSRWHLLRLCTDGGAEPVVLESDGRKPGVWTKSAKRCQETSPDDQGKFEGCTVSTEELC
jgi:hypothetical protein